MEHNINIYQIGVRYILCLLTGMAGGLLYDSMHIVGFILATVSFYCYLEAILAFSLLNHLRGKNDAKSSFDDFH